MYTLHHKKHEHKSDRNSTAYLDLLDILIYAVSISAPLFTLPQLFLIWTSKNVSGVSLLTWIGYLFVSLIWFLYGVAHKSKPIILGNALWLTVEIGVIIGIVLFTRGT